MYLHDTTFSGHFLRSLKSGDGNADHFMRALREDGGSHFLRALRSGSKDLQRILKRFSVESSEPVNIDNEKRTNQDHFLRSLKSNEAAEHFLRSLVSCMYIRGGGKIPFLIV